MFNKFKKGFTIIELVIVIAVIAILSAVLIPVFSGVIEKSKISNDKAFVRNLNTMLYLDNEREDGVEGAVNSLYKSGINLKDTKLQNSDGEILYDSVNKCFVYTEDGVNLEYIGVEKLQEVENDKLYKFYKTVSEIDKEINLSSGYGIYYIGNEITTKFKNYKTQTYYIGKKNSVKSTTFFDETVLEKFTIPSNGEGFRYNSGTKNFNFDNEGFAKICLEYNGVTVFTLPLTVVDAKNFTTAGTSDCSVVLLNNVTGTVTVDENCTIYYNGFTIK